jgi:DNA-binding LacI/PurR family transcriptional regulator
VHGGRPLSQEGGPVCFVDIDNVGGGRQATDHLLRLGRRRIATLTGPADMVAGVERRQGYEACLRESGQPLRPELVADGDFSYASGMDAMARVLQAAPDVDAVFAASDLMAMGAMRVLRESGRAVPEDVAVVGFDDSPGAPHSEPPLTTVHQPAERMGEEMARLLADRIMVEEPGPESVILDTRLVVRESA